MDLSSPLRTLAPSLESSILEVLAGTESALSASTIARLSRHGTRGGQWTVLTRLVRHGLVLAEPANTGSLYRLNRDHVLAPAVLAAVSARQEVLTRLSDAVAALGPDVVSAAVYGSFARREAGEDSDVDLLLVTTGHLDVDNTAWADQVTALEDLFVRWTGNRLEILTLSEDGLRRVVRASEPLADSWRDDAVTIHGRDLASLLSGLPARRTPSRARTAAPR